LCKLDRRGTVQIDIDEPATGLAKDDANVSGTVEMFGSLGFCKSLFLPFSNARPLLASRYGHRLPSTLQILEGIIERGHPTPLAAQERKECEPHAARPLKRRSTASRDVLVDNLNKIAELKERAWADDPILFDRAFNAIVAMLEMCRPSGSIHRDALDNELQTDRNLMLSSILRIYEVNTSAPLARLSPEQRHLVKLKEQLGAIGAEPILQRFAALVHKASTTESPTATDAKELWRITRMLLVEPAVLSAAGSMTIDVAVMPRGPDGKLVPAEENKK
jgi:hypothetical protein